MKKGKRILVVDDDAAIRESLFKLLQDAGYEAVLASDGQEGEARLAEEFDLLILDLGLPRVSGWEILERLPMTQPLLPVIVLTGMMDECEPGSMACADVSLEKPPDVVLLLNLVERLLSEPAGKRMRRAFAALAPAPSAAFERMLGPSVPPE